MFLGRSVTQHKQVSDDTAHAIDEEVRSIIDLNYARAETILKENLEKLHMMAKALVKYETIGQEQIADIMNGKEPRPPEDWEDTGESTIDKDSSKPETESTGSIGGPGADFPVRNGSPGRHDPSWKAGVRLPGRDRRSQCNAGFVL